MNLKCIVIDDEPLALRQMQAYISKVPFLELEGCFNNAIEARNWLEEGEGIDLIFVDINMPDLSGLDFVRQLTIHPMVIFTTAYSEYAIEGFKLDAVDYLLKPFSFNEFQRAATKAHSIFELIHLKNSQKEEYEISDQSSEKESISIRADHKTTIVKYQNIIYIESAGEYIRLHLSDGTKIVTLFRLKNMESTLPSDRFIRVHRSYIINIDHITGYTKGRVFLTGEEYVPIGENYKESFAEIAERL